LITLRIRDSSPPRFVIYRADRQRVATTPTHRLASHFFTHAAANRIAVFAGRPIDVELCECTPETLAPIVRL
jgi:hypothetical protein